MRRRGAAFVAGGACALALGVTAGVAQEPAPLFPAGGGPVDVEGTVEGCADCHAEITREWESSAHAASWTDPVFQAEYTPAPQTFCRNCHAPRAASAEVRGVEARGVDCAVCHEREGTLLGVHGHGSSSHAMRSEPRLAETSFCAPCHEFEFPHGGTGERRPTYLPGRPLQATVSEHARSEARDQSCQSCHMRQVGGHVDHRFPGLADASLVRNAVRVRVRATEDERGALRVNVRLTPRDIGHAFPTGDIFRQGRFEVRRGRSHDVELLQRWFSQTPGDDAFYLAEVDDTRVPPDGARTFSLELPPGEGQARFRFDIWRLDPAVARERGLPVDLVRVPVASGPIRVTGAGR